MWLPEQVPDEVNYYLERRAVLLNNLKMIRQKMFRLNQEELACVEGLIDCQWHLGGEVPPVPANSLEDIPYEERPYITEQPAQQHFLFSYGNAEPPASA